MKSRSCRAAFLSALPVVPGCDWTGVSQQTPVVNEAIARPNRIWVYDFVASPGDIPADSPIAGQVSAPRKPPTAEQTATGNQLGGLIAKELAADIQAMGLSAVRARPGSSPQVGDRLIRRYLVSVETGSAPHPFS